MHSDSRMQHQILPRAENCEKKDLQHRDQIYRAKDIPRSTMNQEVSQECQPGSATKRNIGVIPNVTHKSQEEFATQSDDHTGDKSLLTYTSKKPHVCGVCQKGFTQKSKLRRHSRIHTEEKKTYECEVCHKSYATPKVLETHNLIHTGEKPYECEVCHKAFTTRQHLQNHNLTHTGEKPHECEVCHKSFSQKSNLKQHSLIHSGKKKPFECEVCHKAFTSKKVLQKHNLTHTGEKPHVCDICNRGFNDKSNLSRHRAIHQSQKQRMCPICCTVFSRNIRLKKHIMAQHGEKEDICGKCNKGSSQKSILRSQNNVHSADQEGNQKNLKVLKNAEEVKDREDQIRLDEAALKTPLQQIPETIVNQEKRIHVNPQDIPILKESDNFKPANNGSRTQALFPYPTFPIVDQQVNTTLEYQPMDNVGASTLYPFAGDQNLPNSLEKVDKSLDVSEAYLEENYPEAGDDQRPQEEEVCEEFNQTQTVPVSIQEAPEPRVDQYQQEVHVDQQDVCIPIELDNFEIAYSGENDHHQPPVSLIERQISMESYQEFSTIDFSAIELSFNHSS